ncbi:Protein Aster-B [Taenia crassiceps]|uniref:Protein Aster-B n=1 Tax=Taenia crassiceps TaxID=6207 RepID=A0ABR4QNL9_9CEST
MLQYPFYRPPNSVQFLQRRRSVDPILRWSRRSRMNTSDHDLPSNSVSSKVNVARDDGQPRVSRSLFLSRPCDSISIPSLSSFLSVESGRATLAGGLSPCRSSPILITQHASFSDTERDTRTVDSGLPGTYGDADDGELEDIDEEDEIGSNASDLFSSYRNLMPNPSSNDESVGAGCDFYSIRTFEASSSDPNKVSIDGNSRNIYSSKKPRNPSKRKISNWYQVKRETLVKSYRAKVNHFKKIFDGTPVDTDRLLVDYSCALAKNRNGLLLLGRMYITEKWICFYSKIIYELKLHIAVDDVQTVSKAKTARLFPNAIQITLKSNNERYFFTSFASRERTFAILKKVCENSRNGGGLLPSESEIANMEELLCQVQDVYGDESLAVLDFEDGDDLDDDVHLTNRGSRVASSSEWNESSVGSTLPSPCSEFMKLQIPPRQRQRPSTDDETPLRPRVHVPQPHSFVHEGSAPHSFSFYEMSESDTTATSATSDDDLVEGNREGIQVNFRKTTHESDKGCRPSRKVNRTPLSPRELAAAVVTHHSESAAPHDSTNAVDDGYEEEQLQPVSCGTGHKHPGRTYADTDINVSVDALFTCLFTDSQFFASFCAHRGTFDVDQSRWPPKPWPTPTTGDATINRKISYVLTLKQRLGPRTCRAFESQAILLRETRPGMRYVVDATVTNEAVPLCNSFHVTTRYCLLRRSATVSHLMITSEVIYDRPVFFGAKSIIDSTCRSNLTDNFTDLVNHLSAAVARLSDRDRITGGALSRPHQPQITRPQLETEEGASGGIGGEGVGTVGITSTPGSGTGVQQISRGLSIPQVLLYPNQQSDRKWFFVVAMSLGLCVFLSMVYNRYQRVERIASDPLEFTARASRSGSSCCDELTSVRLLVESVSGVLAQMRTTLDLLERRLNQLGLESFSSGLIRLWLSRRCIAFTASAASSHLCRYQVSASSETNADSTNVCPRPQANFTKGLREHQLSDKLIPSSSRISVPEEPRCLIRDIV